MDIGLWEVGSKKTFKWSEQMKKILLWTLDLGKWEKQNLNGVNK